jgi:hypothetical protein
VLEHIWERVNKQSNIAQIDLHQKKAKEVLQYLHGGSSGGYLDVSKTLNKVRQRYYWLQTRGDFESVAYSVISTQHTKVPKLGAGAR